MQVFGSLRSKHLLLLLALTWSGCIAVPDPGGGADASPLLKLSDPKLRKDEAPLLKESLSNVTLTDKLRFGNSTLGSSVSSYPFIPYCDLSFSFFKLSLVEGLSKVIFVILYYYRLRLSILN
jgi:hypothetical protein